MRWSFLIIALLIGAVLSNIKTVAIIPPWQSLKLPDTEQACIAAKGEWVKASNLAYMFRPETDYKPAYCRMTYADAGSVCTVADQCQSHVCIVHPIKRKGSCLGTLPPYGHFEFFDNKGNIRRADFLL